MSDFWMIVTAVAITVGVIVAIAVLVPSCEDQGMHTTFSHMQPYVTSPDSKNIVISMMPVYTCTK